MHHSSTARLLFRVRKENFSWLDLPSFLTKWELDCSVSPCWYMMQAPIYLFTLTGLIFNIAMAGTDFILATSYEIFTSGSTDNATRCVDIAIIDDDALEGNQTFIVVLNTSDPDVIFLNNETAITIRDDDSECRWFLQTTRGEG